MPRAKPTERTAVNRVAEPPAAFTHEISVTATVAQNEFGRMLTNAAQNRVVVINRHNAPSAVLISFDRYRELTQGSAAALNTLAGQFEALVETMQSQTSRNAMKRAFDAPPATLGRSAAAANRRAKRK